MSSQKYTRWRTNEEDDDDLEDGDISFDRDDDTQEESRRSFTMMTPQSEEKKPLTPIMTCRLIGTLILALLVAFTVGALIGYLGTNKSTSNSSHNMTSCVTNTTPILPTPCPTPEARPTSTVPPPEREEITFKQEDFHMLNLKLAPHLTKDKIKEYSRKINEAPTESLPSFIESTFKKINYLPRTYRFHVKSSSGDYQNPNSVEAVFGNSSSQVVSESYSDKLNMSFFSAFGPNGTATGCLVYANFATEDDLKTLNSSGVQKDKCIFLVRIGKIHPGMQVKNSADFGASGVLLYPDPKEFSGNEYENKSSSAPGGLPLDGVVWESLRFFPGDPSTPGIPSQSHVYRLPQSSYANMPPIPTQPISGSSAQYLLGLLGGKEVPTDWKGGLPLNYTFGGSFKESSNVTEIRLNVFNAIGDSSVPVVHSYHHNAKSLSYILHLGCRLEIRDGKISGSSLVSLASLLAFAESLDAAYPDGTLVPVMFSVFPVIDSDASGSYEFLEYLSHYSTAIAYIDFDNIFQGVGYFEARASPLLKKAVQEVLEEVSWPEDRQASLVEGLSRAFSSSYNHRPKDRLSYYLNSFEIKMPYVCGDSGYFYIDLGMESVQFTSIGINKSSEYLLKNSQYDTLDAVFTLDPDLKWTHTAASVLGVVVLSLSTQVPMIRFDDFPTTLKNDFEVLKHKAIFSDPNLMMAFQSFSTRLDRFEMQMGSLNDMLSKFNNKTSSKRSIDQVYAIFEKYLVLSRLFLRPRSLSSPAFFGSLLTYGPDPKNPCAGIAFPGVAAVLEDVKAGTRNVSELHREFSYLYSFLPYIDILDKEK